MLALFLVVVVLFFRVLVRLLFLPSRVLEIKVPKIFGTCHRGNLIPLDVSLCGIDLVLSVEQNILSSGVPSSSFSSSLDFPCLVAGDEQNKWRKGSKQT